MGDIPLITSDVIIYFTSGGSTTGALLFAEVKITSSLHTPVDIITVLPEIEIDLTKQINQIVSINKAIYGELIT